MTSPPQSFGSGPGAITPDGCSVEFYARMTAREEPGIVHEAIGPRSSILELGCGAGRVTHPLVALGHRVVAVDESAEMLAHVRGAETVCGPIEELALDRRFDVVLLASHLVNADPPTRTAFLAACRQHVTDDGCVIIEQFSPEWFSTVAPGESTRDGIIFRLRDLSRPAPNLVAATVEYVDGDRCWTQTFTAFRLDDPAEVLAEAGLRLEQYLTDDGTWLRAVPG